MFTSLLSLALLTGPTPQSVMHAYWDRLAKAHRLHAKFTIPDPSRHLAETWDCWLERPFSIRLQGAGLMIKSDGKTTTIQIAATGETQRRKFIPNDLPPIFEPFFGRHRWDAPGWAMFAGRRCVMLFARKSAPAATRIYLDLKTGLPVGTTNELGAQSYPGAVRTLVLDPPNRPSPAGDPRRRRGR